MKKKIFGGVAVLAIAVVAALNVIVSTNNHKISDISLTNVEALAGENLDCPNGCYPNGSGCYKKCKEFHKTYKCLKSRYLFFVSPEEKRFFEQSYPLLIITILL